MDRTKVVIMGAAGRDFHDFNVVYRDDPTVEVVAFTATQIPGIADRRYPPELAGPLYPAGIPIVPEDDLDRIFATQKIDRVVFAYSDVTHEYVMHQASRALAGGANFVLLGPVHTMVASTKPVVATGATRTGAGKSQTTRYLARLLEEQGLRVVVVRHPMPYGDLVKQRVQRFATYADLDRHETTIEEREEYEPHLDAGPRPLRRRGLRGDPPRGREGGRRRRLGRRQQRLPVLQAGPVRRRGRPAPAGPRDALPPGRDEHPDGRRRGHQQGGQRDAGAGGHGPRGHRQPQSPGRGDPGPLRAPARGRRDRGQARRDRRGRPDADPRRHDLRGRRRGRAPLRRRRARGPAPVRQGRPRPHACQVPGPGEPAAGHGLRPGADARARGDPQRDAGRPRPRREPDRPHPGPDPREADRPRPLRARGARARAGRPVARRPPGADRGPCPRGRRRRSPPRRGRR